MTNKERVATALAHKQPDKLPFNMSFTKVARQKMVEYTGDEQFDRNWERYLISVELAMPETKLAEEPGVSVDEWGVHWDRRVEKDIGVVSNVRVNPDNVDTVSFPDPALPARYARLQSVINEARDTFVLGSIGFSLFERAWTLAGMENVLVAMVMDKPFINRLLDRILEYNLAVIDRACAYPIDGMRFGDDWGSQTGVLMGPQLWREFIGSRIKQMYARVKSHGKAVFIHSCGKVDELFPDLIEYGLDAFNPFQPEVIDVYAAKKTYGNKLTFYGGISTQRLLPYGTPQQVRDEVRRLLDEVGKDGGLIAAPAHSIPGDARPENVLAMVETLHNQ